MANYRTQQHRQIHRPGEVGKPRLRGQGKPCVGTFLIGAEKSCEIYGTARERKNPCLKARDKGLTNLAVLFDVRPSRR